MRLTDAPRWSSTPSASPVGFYQGDAPGGVSLGTASTRRTLYPAEGESVLLSLPDPPAEVLDGSVAIYAVVDDGIAPHPSWTECRTDNNVSSAASGACAP